MSLIGPVFQTAALIFSIAAATAIGGTFGQNRQLFAQYGVGGPAQTILNVHNPGETGITVGVELFNSDGSVFQMQQVSVAAGATETVVLSDPEGPVRDGWAQLTSDALFNSTVFFQIEGVGNVGVLPSQQGVKFRLITFVGDGTDTGFALANPSPTHSSTVTMRVFDTAGTFQKEVERTYGPGEHEALFVTEDPLQLQSDNLIEFVASNPIILLGLRTDDSLLASTVVIQPQGAELPAGSINTHQLADGAVTGQKVAAGTITSTQLAANSVGLSELAPETSFGRVQVGPDGSPNLILGHPENSIPAGTLGATVGGGGRPDFPNAAAGNFSTVSGGFDNTAVGPSSTVSGGARNTAAGSAATVAGGSGNSATGDRSVISGGINNLALAFDSTVAGGFTSTASGGRSTVGGGRENLASGVASTVSGGAGNTAAGDGATVPGGRDNLAQERHSLAAGQGAQALHDGTFVWADDSTQDPFASTNAFQFLIRASNGVGINTNDPQGALDVNGQIFQSGAVLHADYVFEEGYPLESIEEHAESMWREKHLPAVGPGTKNAEGLEYVEYGSRMRGILEELEKAHIYIEQLNRTIGEMQERLARLEE